MISEEESFFKGIIGITFSLISAKSFNENMSSYTFFCEFDFSSPRSQSLAGHYYSIVYSVPGCPKVQSIDPLCRPLSIPVGGKGLMPFPVESLSKDVLFNL